MRSFKPFIEAGASVRIALRKYDMPVPEKTIFTLSLHNLPAYKIPAETLPQAPDNYLQCRQRRKLPLLVQLLERLA